MRCFCLFYLRHPYYCQSTSARLATVPSASGGSQCNSLRKQETRKAGQSCFQSVRFLPAFLPFCIPYKELDVGWGQRPRQAVRGCFDVGRSDVVQGFIELFTMEVDSRFRALLPSDGRRANHRADANQKYVGPIATPDNHRRNPITKNLHGFPAKPILARALSATHVEFFIRKAEREECRKQTFESKSRLFLLSSRSAFLGRGSKQLPDLRRFV